jgi:hypothetical protein
MLFAELFSLVSYIITIVIYKDFFGEDFKNITGFMKTKPIFIKLYGVCYIVYFFSDPWFIWTLDFAWKTSLITAASCVPLFVIKCLRLKFSPPTYQKIAEQ